jgi:hypothetical protein
MRALLQLLTIASLLLFQEGCNPVSTGRLDIYEGIFARDAGGID